MTSRLPPPIISVQKHCQLRFLELLNEFFAVSSDHLIALAQNTSKSVDKEIYLSAQRELWLNKRKIFTTFLDGIDRRFLGLVDEEALASQNDVFSSAQYDRLALVDEDDLEQLAVKEAMVNRSIAQHKPIIEQLTARFNAMMELGVSVDEASLPVAPGRLCDLFIETCHALDIPSRARTELFKLFERTILLALGSLYSSMNSHFDSWGLQAAMPAQNTAEPLSDHSRSAQNVTSETISLASESAENTLTPSAPADEMAIATADESAIASDAEMKPTTVSPLVGTTGAVKSGREQIIARTLTSLCEKHRLAKVFIPVLKLLHKPLVVIALHDDGFFNNRHNETRRLLNTMLSAAMTFPKARPEDMETDPLYAEIKMIATKLHSGNYSDPKAISALIEEFDYFLGQSLRRAELFEKRMLAAETAKHETHMTQLKVRDAIEEITRGIELHVSVRHIIDGAWYQVMYVAALKYGIDSAQWDEATQILTDLTVIAQPCVSEAEAELCLASLEGLKQRVRVGLESLFFSPFETDNIIDKLEQAVRELGSTNSTVTRALLTNMPEVNHNQRALASIIKTPAEEEFIRQAKKLTRGAWFDLVVAESDVARCRLVAVIGGAGTERYLFVHRNGCKVADKSLDEVARALAKKNLIPVNTHKVFDAALAQVILGAKKA